MQVVQKRVVDSSWWGYSFFGKFGAAVGPALGWGSISDCAPDE